MTRFAIFCLQNKDGCKDSNKSSVGLEYNQDQEMVSPGKIHFFQNITQYRPLSRLLIELFDKSEMETAKVMKFLSEKLSDVENLDFLDQDIRFVIRDIRRPVFDYGNAKFGLALLRDYKKVVLVIFLSSGCG